MATSTRSTSQLWAWGLERTDPGVRIATAARRGVEEGLVKSHPPTGSRPLVKRKPRKRALAVEVKWNRIPIRGREVMEDLQRRTASCQALQGCAMTHIVIARKGFSDRPRSGSGERFIDLQMEKLPG